MNKSMENIIFMKYGVHASENVNSIITRKKEEIANCNKMFWGYGGVVCHPQNQIQPFLLENALRGEKTYLVLSETSSKLYNTAARATSYSIDKKCWIPFEEGINVLGSKYAIVCGSLEECDIMLDLNKYTIPIGASKGKLLSNYVSGRVDKACGRYCDNQQSDTPTLIKISFCAEVILPSAVYVK